MKTGDRGAVAFYLLKERRSSLKPPLQSVAFAHQILAHDAKRDIMLQILQKIQQKKSINISADLASEEKE